MPGRYFGNSIFLWYHAAPSAKHTTPRLKRNRTKNTHQASNGRADGLDRARAIALGRRSRGRLAGRRLRSGRLRGRGLSSRGLRRARPSRRSGGGRTACRVTGLGARRRSRRLASAGSTRRRGGRVRIGACRLRVRAVVEIALASVTEGVVAGERVAGGADAVVERAAGQVEAEGHLLDGEAHLGGGARNRASGTLRNREGDVGQLGVGSPLLDGVVEGVEGQEDVDSASASATTAAAAAATGRDELLDGGGIGRCARRRSLLWVESRSVIDCAIETDFSNSNTGGHTVTWARRPTRAAETASLQCILSARKTKGA